MGRRSVRLFRLSALVLCACSAASSKEPAPPQPNGVSVAPPFESPARWASYPESVGTPTSTLTLADGRCLVLTDDGQRWLVDPADKSKPCTGRGTASGSPSVEPLVFVEKLADAYRFVGDGGVVYTARDPVGPFDRAVRAPTFLVRIGAGGSTVVGVDRAGKTFHFVDGGWKPSGVPSRAFGIDVSVDAKGRAIWLGAPEAVMLSSDGGRTFAPIATSPTQVGPWQAAVFDGDKLGLLGVLGSVVLEGDRLVRSPSNPTAPKQVDAQIQPSRGPKETLLRTGVAAVSGRTYYEVVEGEEGAARYALLRTELGGTPETLPLKGTERCDAIRVAANGSAVALACMTPQEGREDLSLDLELSTDGGKTFTKLAGLLAQTFGDVHLSVASGGSVLVTGACEEEPRAEAPDKPPGRTSGRAQKSAGGGCAPKAPVLVRREKNKVVIVSGSGSQIEQGSARSPVLSQDGRFAYVLARTRREGRMALFLSRDGGRTYAERRIELVSSGWDDGDDSTPVDGDRILSIPERARLTMDEAGSLGLACDGSSGATWVTLDSDGRVQTAGAPPQSGAQLGGHGSRVLAVGFGTDDILHAWESLDGGNNFTEVTVTQAVQRFATHGEWGMACAAGGCVLGDELVRVGWEGQSETPFEITEETLSSPDVSLAAPLSCRFAPKTEWTKIGGVGEDGSLNPRMPRLRDLARGKTAWSVLALEPSGKIVVASAPLPERSADAKDKTSPAAPTFKQLLGPPQGKGTALIVKPQAEGYVAMRAPVPRTKSGAVDTSAAIDKVELAWQNQYFGVTARRTVRFDEKWSSSLLASDKLRPLLLTVTSGGVTVRPTTKRATYFDAESGASTFDYPEWLDLLKDRREVSAADAAIVGGAPAAIAFIDRSPAAQVFAIAKPAKTPGSAPAVEALTVASGAADLEWVASGDKTGVAALTLGPGGAERAEAWLISDRGTDAEPIPLARLSHLADAITPCTSDQRRTTARSVSSHFASTGALVSTVGRRPVLVTDAPSPSGGPLAGAVMEPIWLLTDGAVMHGSPSQPCIATWKASGLRTGFVAVIAGDLDHAWLLQSATEAEMAPTPPGSGPSRSPPRPTRSLYARPMSCRLDTSLPIPAEVAARAAHRLPDDQP